MIHCSMASLHEAVNCRVFLGNSCVVALFLKNGGMAKLCEDESEAKRNWASAVFVPAGKDMPATRRSDDDESTVTYLGNFRYILIPNININFMI